MGDKAMMPEKTWDNIQDGARLLLSVAILAVSPKIGTGLKIATFAIGLVNRTLKIGNIFEDRKDIWEKISLEQENAFKNAWKRTRLELDKDTLIKVSTQLEAILKVDLKELTSYSDEELNQAFNNCICDYKRFNEWNAQAADIRAIYTCYMSYYNEEVLNTKILKSYYNGEKISNVIADLNEIKEQIGEITSRVVALEKPSKELLYSFSNEDIEYYYAWLTNYIEKETSLYTDVNIIGYYDENIFELNTRFDSQTWKQEVISSLQNAKLTLQEGTSLYNKITQTIAIISGTVKYDVVHQLVYDIAHTGKWNKEIKSEFKDELKGKYSKVAVISGEPGSGKTHFLREYLNQVKRERNKRIFAIPIECRELIDAGLKDDSSLEKYFLNKINYCFHTRLENLASLVQNDNYRIVFIIDNFQRLFIYAYKLFKLVLHNIEELTKYDYIYWLITLNEQDIYILNNNMNIIQKYCMRFKFDDLFFNYSFNLTLYNERNSIGEKILSLYNKKLYKMDIDVLCRKSGENFICQPINNPLYAHIIGKYSLDKVIPYIATYLEFITTLTQYIDNKIKVQEPTQYDLIINSIISIVDYTLYKGSIVYSSTDLANISSKNVIDIIRDNGLLRWLKENNDILSLQYLEDYYKLYTSVYWVLKMVLFLLQKNNSDYIEIYEQLNKLSEYKDELIPCFLLCLDNGGKSEAYCMLFTSLLKQHDIHYALFCSHKASIKFKKELCSVLLIAENTEFSGVETFALLYYLNYYKAKTVDQNAVICKYIHSIYKNNFLYNLNMLISKTVNQAKDLKKFKRDIKPFFLVDIVEINHMLGYMLSNKYYSLIEKEYLGKQINDLIEYLDNNRQAIEYALITNNSSFIDFFLRGYFTRVINGKNTSLTQLYDTMEEQECFYKEKFGILLRRNLSCAAGNIYEMSSNPTFCAEYLSLVQKIMSKKDFGSYTFAFHFISNSINDNKNNSLLVSSDFIPILETIWSDPNMEMFCKQNKKRRIFFEKNINRKKGSSM